MRSYSPSATTGGDFFNRRRHDRRHHRRFERRDRRQSRRRHRPGGRQFDRPGASPAPADTRISPPPAATSIDGTDAANTIQRRGQQPPASPLSSSEPTWSTSQILGPDPRHAPSATTSAAFPRTRRWRNLMVIPERLPGLRQSLFHRECPARNTRHHQPRQQLGLTPPPHTRRPPTAVSNNIIAQIQAAQPAAELSCRARCPAACASAAAGRMIPPRSRRVLNRR